jgi:hypothetical protein
VSPNEIVIDSCMSNRHLDHTQTGAEWRVAHGQLVRNHLWMASGKIEHCHRRT